MKVKDLIKSHYEPSQKFPVHSKNDILATVNKVLEGSHISTIGLKMISTDNQISKGLLIFKDKKTRYKINYEGKIFHNATEIGEVKKSGDLHSQYSNAIFLLIKWIKENEG